jgi:hypothetical protein
MPGAAAVERPVPEFRSALHEGLAARESLAAHARRESSIDRDDP